MVPWEHNQQTEPIRTWKTIVKAENNSSANIASLLKFLLIRSFQIDFVECFTETTFKNKNTHHFHILFISYINDSMRILKGSTKQSRKMEPKEDIHYFKLFLPSITWTSKRSN